MARFTYQFGKTDTLASQMAAAATSGTLSAGNFDNFTGDFLVLDYNNPSKREVIKCNVTGTAIASATRGVEGSDVTHSAGAAVAYAFLPDHAEFISLSAEEGWIESNDTWVYASASTFTIAGVDRTTTYQKGTKLRWKQGGGYKYGVVASSSFSTNTTVTIIVNTDYTIANAAITDNDFSYIESPVGFPSGFAYTPTGIAASNVTLTGRYSVRGMTNIVVDIYAAFTGGITFTTMPSLPVAASASGTGVSTQLGLKGVCSYEDNGTSYILNGLFPTVVESATTVVIRNSTGGSMSATVPITWANLDKLYAHFDYEF